MARIIDGRSIAQKINEQVASAVERLASGQERPVLASVTVGYNDDSRLYVNMQKKVASQVGIEFDQVELDRKISEEDLLSELLKIDSKERVTSIILQKPLPPGFDHHKLIQKIRPGKDAEGLHPCNLGLILRKEADIVPSTPGAVMKILSSLEEELYGKRAVIIGHSAIVGKPLSLMLLNEMATTTVCHVATDQNGQLSEYTRMADIVIVAVGKPGLLRGNMIKPGATVVDVGINYVEGRVVGDVNFEEAEKVAGAITPVPGGVGPVTVSILMRNVLRAFLRGKGNVL